MLLDELKRRGVLRVAAVYAVGAFAAIQAADIVLPRLGLPDWTVTAIIVGAIAGFPIALILAWLYDVKRDTSDFATRRRRPSYALLIAGVILLIATGAWLFTRSDEADTIDNELIAVLPFRVTGAAPDLAYLREGMVDLLAAKLGGTEGMRTVDSRAALAAWRSRVPNEQTDLPVEQATSIARGVGAGQLVLGEIVGVASKLVLTASLVDVKSKGVTRATVEGSADSLPRLVDRLAGQLLALRAGEDEYRLEYLVSTSLPALRAYLQGKQAYRRGEYEVSAKHYQDALELDSTFALATSALAEAAGWFSLDVQRDAIRKSWQQRHRLPPRDRVLVEAFAGPRYPAPITGREFIAGAERAARLLPDNPEAWYLFADALYHWGPAVGADRAFERARDAMAHTLRLDSSFSAPYDHAVELAAIARDTAEVRALATAYLARHTSGESPALIRWLAAAATNDEAALRAMWQRMDSIPFVVVLWMAAIGQDRQLRPHDLDRYLPALERHAPFWSAWLLINAGKPERAMRTLGPCWEARAATARASTCDEDTAESLAIAARWIVPAALFGEVDTTHAIKLVAPLERNFDALPHDQLCTVEQWRTWRGDLRTVNQSIARLNSVNQDGARQCAVMLQAIAAVRGKRNDARGAVDNLEQLVAQGQSDLPLRFLGNLISARLLEEMGDVPAALKAVRRRARITLTPTVMLATYVREEGRLARLAGDRDGARRAYSHYLNMRPDPEPAVRPHVDAVRRELAALTADRRN